MTYDYLIVGAGFAGSVMARQLADAGQRVLITDKRDHIGGNAYDYTNEHGVRIHKYGPHIFHTNSDKVWNFLSRFTEWRPYEHRVLASVQDKLLPFPINIDTINQLYGLALDEDGMRAFLAGRVARDWPQGKEIKTAEDQIVSQIGRELFDIFFAGYTKKMWGVPASELDKSVTARIPIRFNHDDRYFTDKYQAMPKDGYTALFERMLDHEDIQIMLGQEAGWGNATTQPTIWTGPIDAAFTHRFGPLPYRSMRFESFRAQRTDATLAATLNFPEPLEPWTRATDWRVLAGSDQCDTVITEEYPQAKGEPYYPIPSPQSAALYAKYEALAREQSNVTFLGRLGNYRYMNMDQVVGQALATFARLNLAQAHAS